MSRQHINAYRRTLAEQHRVTGSLNERVIRKAFAELLESTGRSHDLVFTNEWEGRGPRGNLITVDGALVPPILRKPFGYWEAKDSKDDLDKEIAVKIAAGYRSTSRPPVTPCPFPPAPAPQVFEIAGNSVRFPALLLQTQSQELTMANGRTATLHRMVLPDHTCPYGVRAKAMLEEAGFEVDDQILKSREEVDSFMEQEGIDTTPLIVIDGNRIGGSAELERYLDRQQAEA